MWEQLPKMRGLQGEAGFNILKDFIAGYDVPFGCVQAAGTNGKGSVSVITAAILRNAGIKTGLFISPHIMHWNERISVDGVDIPSDELYGLYLATRAKAERAGVANILCQSDYLLCCALEYFKRAGVGAAVLECGLGGGLDGTSAVNRVAAAITRIDIDHTNVLGNTIVSIADKKCGLISPGMIIVTGKQHIGAMRVIRAQCKEYSARLVVASKPENITVKEGMTAFRVGRRDYRVGMTGEFQADNACVAMDLARAYLNACGKRLYCKTAFAAMEGASIPGRMQVISYNPITIIDCSHNAAAVRQCAETVKTLYPNKKIIALCAIMPDKEYHEMIDAIPAYCIICTQCGATENPDKLAACVKGGEAHSIAGFRQAFDMGARLARDMDFVLVITGGFAITRATLELIGQNRYNVS